MATIQISKPTNFEYNTNNQDSSFDYNNAITANSECNLPIPFTDKLGKWVGIIYRLVLNMI